eukprot:Nitzschia sp. Nitz4//scaffold63_size106090//85030//85570//NITZ4_004408-RA/size106090-augustus-gene-0.162-mRNA-1//1//CDS//3329556029//2711//frame0
MMKMGTTVGNMMLVILVMVTLMEPMVLAREPYQTPNRHLEATFDFFDIDVDICDNRPASMGDGPPILGTCDTSRFPVCASNRQICYNRKPSRHQFEPDTHEPVFYIQYDRVYCYPNYWGGCSSCTPGRYCVSEERCVLDEHGYECEEWY